MSWLRANQSARDFARDLFFIVVGSVVQALSIVLFYAPADLAPGGVSGIGFILSRVLPFPISIGVLTFVLNIPLLALGIRFLGGWRFLARTVLTVFLYTGFTSLFEQMGIRALSNDILLNTLFGGVIGGFGAGLVLRARATTGGTDILALLLSRFRGIALSQSYLATDAGVILLAGLIFGWDKALYALISLYVGGLVTEATSEGAHISRMAFVITNQPEKMSHAIMAQLGRGLTRWVARGGFTGEERPILFCVISRAETAMLRGVVADIDPDAFLVIGQSQEVYGEGFRRFEK